MSLTIILDTGPLGKVSNPKDTLENNAATDWLKAHIASGNRIIVPEIANYELRRELLLGNKMRGLQKLDDLLVFLEYLPLKTAAIYEAAHCWAEARKKGKPTAHPHALDGDMLLVAQVRLLNDPTAVVATVDVGDLPQFVPAKLWSDIV